MAAPTLVQSGTGTVITGASGAVAGLTATAGNFLILHVCVDGTGSGFSTSGGGTGFETLLGGDGSVTHITPLAPLDNQIGNPNAGDQYLACARALGGAVSGTINTAGPDLYARWYEFSGVAAGTALADVLENSSAGSFVNGFGTSTTVDDTSVTTLGADRLACNFIAINDDATGIASFTGESGGDWTQVASFESSTGTDGTIALQTATISSAGTIGGGTATITSDAWGVTGLALRPAVVAAFVARPLMLEYQQAVGRGSIW